MSISGIRTALKTALDALVTAGKLRAAFDTAPATINALPAAYIVLAPDNPVSYHGTAADGMVTYRFAVIVLVMQGNSLEQAQATLDTFLDLDDAACIMEALEGATLTTHGSVAVCMGATAYGVMNYNGTEYVGCRFLVEVIK